MRRAWLKLTGVKALFNASQVRLIEAQCLAQVAPGELIRRAGLALARHAEHMTWTMPSPVRIHALCGPGNNGADARMAASALNALGFETHLHSLPQLLAAAEHAHALEAFVARLDEHSLIIDGVFGIGLSRPVDPALGKLFEAINASRCKILAVDIPSGLDASNGQVLGAALRSDLCLSMLVDKTGLHTGQAAALAPAVEIDNLGCAAVLEGQGSLAVKMVLEGRHVGLWSGQDLPARLPRRPAVAHKGTQGSVLIIGGSSGMRGAALLAAQGAQAGGSGKVFVHFPDGLDSDLEAMAMQHPSLLGFKRPAAWEGALAPFDAVLIGCGLGLSRAAHSVLADIMKECRFRQLPLVLDADALNLIADSPALQEIFGLKNTQIEARPASPQAPEPGLPWVMTPHPLEAARLLAGTTAEIQADRYRSARALCQRFGVSLILKGPGSVIASPIEMTEALPEAGLLQSDPGQQHGEGSLPARPSVRLAVAPPGSPALAVAGSGDTLAGLVLSLLGQGLPPHEAATLAASVHALAGMRWAENQPRGQGMRAEDLPSLIVDWMNFEH